MLDSDRCGLLPLVLKSVIPQLDGSSAEGLLLEVRKSVGVPFHGGAAEALGDVDFDFLFAAEPHGVLDALDKVVNIPNVGITGSEVNG